MSGGNYEQKELLLLLLYCIFYVYIFFTSRLGGELLNGENLAKLCVAAVYPSVDFQDASESEPADDFINTGSEEKSRKVETLKCEEKSEKKKNVKIGKPLVLLYHTHATEAYLPSTEGNYHKVPEKDTVREVGNVLEGQLEARGINVIHDKTIHDNPSYNESYDRSFTTIKALLAKYPTIVYSIDLHRDAVPGTPKGSTIHVGDRECSGLSYVLSTDVASYSRNRAFVDKINSLGEKRYGDFKGVVRERPYTYNQELGKCMILLEVGNNRNTITEGKNCAKVYGELLAEVINEEM